MEFTESILDSINEEPSLEDSDDVEMMDVEEGEVVDGQISEKMGEGSASEAKTETRTENSQDTRDMNKNKNRRKKKKNKKKKGHPGSNAINIDRFVLDVCKQLRERKTYLVYTAVGVLGVSALTDLVKEVDAIQACGGQKTADGDRFRKGGGILWNILKARDPNAFKEIMKKGKEFEKQFRQPTIGQRPMRSNNPSQTAVPCKTSAQTSDVVPGIKPPGAEQPAQPASGEKRKPTFDHTTMYQAISIPLKTPTLPLIQDP
ncbi:hypothetical protein Cgig2_011480 [Carnegiea gigantea]|uniref:Phosphorylated adapter RNA export protein n=1 Tax=Carnegiea gigantea TaxID=171969 RepID=A0A9Q1QP01_9CARY|nr:hypothetical protein Cgig2_011480 [Carnegiea gigantea]